MTVIREIIDQGREPEEDRPIPRASGVVDVSTLQDEGDGDAPVVVPTSLTPSSTLGNLPESTAQSLVQTEQPIVRPHPTLSYPSIPDSLTSNALEIGGIVQDQVDALPEPQSIISDMYATGTLQYGLRSTYNRELRSTTPSINSDNIGPNYSRFNDAIQKAKQDSVQRVTVPSINEGFSGVTRTLSDGNPLSTSSQAAIEDSQNTVTEIEPAFPITQFDRNVSAVVSALVPSFLRPSPLLSTLADTPEEIRDARENLSAIGTIGRVSAENLFDAITSIPSDLDRRRREVGIGGLFTDALYNVLSGSLNTFAGPPVPNNPETLPQWMQDRLPYGPLPDEGEPANLTDVKLFSQSLDRNPSTENMFRRFELATRDTGGVDISKGEYGEYGSTSLSGLFYVLSMPQGAVMAGAYTVLDQFILEPEQRTNRFADLLAGGVDFSFNQEFSDDKYLSFIGNPALSLLPRNAQILAGFTIDMFVGGIADDLFSKSVRAAGRSVRTSLGAITDIPVRQLDDVVKRSVDDVIRRPSVPGEDVPRLNAQIDNALRDAPFSDDAKRLVPELEDTMKKFGIDDAKPYRITTAMDDIAEGRQLTLDFMNTRGPLQGRIARAIDVGDIVGESENLVQLRRIDDRVADIQQIIDLSVEAEANQVAQQLTLDDHRQALFNTLDEQQIVASRLDLTEAQQHVRRVNEIYERRGTIRVANNGFIFQSEPNEVYDTIFPTIPLEQIQPRNVNSANEFMFRYRYAPDSVNELDFNMIRRTDSTIENLGRVWSVENGTFRLPQTPVEELGNLFRARSLEQEYPTLLARFGKPVSNRIESPIMRVDFSSQFDTDELVSAIPVVQPTLLLPPVQDGRVIRQQVDSLQRKAVKFSNQIRESVSRADVPKAIQLRDRLEEVTNTLFHTYADNPEIASQIILERQPNSTRPIGATSRALGERFALAEQRFYYETGVLRKLRQDLFEVRDLLDQQRRLVSESPILERVPVVNEMATKRSQGLTTRTATAEMAQPGPNIRAPQLFDIVGDQPTSFQRIRSFEEFSDLTDEQLTRAIFNDSRVTLDDSGIVRPISETDFEPTVSIDATSYYHGTKATSIDVPSYSPSNEFGPALYVSTDKNVARRFARATPARDLLDTSSLTPRFTNQGRIFPIELTDDFNAVNIRSLTEQQTDNLRTIFRTTLEDRGEFIVSRFNSWSKRHEPHEWWHYVRSQFMKNNGGDVLEYAEFAEEVRDKLLLLGVDGIKDGDTVAILNPGKMQTFVPFEDAHSTGGIGEGLLNRYAADYDFHNRMKNDTTQAILEQDRLAVDEFVHSQLKNTVREQQVIATRSTREYNNLANQMESAVDMDKRQLNAIRRDDSIRDTINTHNRTNRQVSDIPKEC